MWLANNNSDQTRDYWIPACPGMTRKLRLTASSRPRNLTLLPSPRTQRSGDPGPESPGLPGGHSRNRRVCASPIPARATLGRDYAGKFVRRAAKTASLMCLVDWAKSLFCHGLILRRARGPSRRISGEHSTRVAHPSRLCCASHLRMRLFSLHLDRNGVRSFIQRLSSRFAVQTARPGTSNMCGSQMIIATRQEITGSLPAQG